VCAGFSAHRVPPELDAVVIGSGMGGLAAAGTLAKVGKRVLVLEQHDQAGGCCHTFQERGTEFDVGEEPRAPPTPQHLPWHPLHPTLAPGCLRVALCVGGVSVRAGSVCVCVRVACRRVQAACVCRHCV